MGILDKAKDLLGKNADKVDTVINKAGDLVDKKTHGKYASTVNKVQDAAKKAVHDNTTTADRCRGRSPGPARSNRVTPRSSRRPPPGPAAPRRHAAAAATPDGPADLLG